MLGRWQGKGSSPLSLIEKKKLRKKLSKLDRKITRLKGELELTPRGFTEWFNIRKELEKVDEQRKLTRLRLKGYDV